MQGDVAINVAATRRGLRHQRRRALRRRRLEGLHGDRPYKFTLPASTLTLGQHRIKVMAYDKLGNVTTTPQVTFSLKDGLPETSIACNSAAC